MPRLRAPDYMEVIGAVKRQGRWRIFSGVVADWIMDYPRYDPGYTSMGSPEFRNGAAVLDLETADRFLQSMAEYEFSWEDVRSMVAQWGPTEYTLDIVVDFDNMTFVNGYSELPIHEYVPGGWTAYEGDPLEYVPPEVRALWRP